MRQLAYTYGKQLIPRQGEFESLYYALNLNDQECPTPLVADSSPTPDVFTSITADALFVDPVHGKDSNPGTETDPLKSVSVAIAHASSGSVVLRDGVHALEAPLLLGSKHSGLTIMAYPGETPVVSGGKALDVTWEPYDVAKSGWEVYEYTSIVYDGTADDKTIRQYSNQDTALDCLRQCEDDDQCTGYTWHDAGQGQYAHVCWGRLDGQWTVTRGGGHVTGRKGKWQITENVSVVSSGKADDISIRDYGKPGDASACASLCSADIQCTSWTWHDANQGAYSNVCWGRLDGQSPTTGQSGHTTGLPYSKNIYRAQIGDQVSEVPGLQLDGVRATRARYPNLPGGIEVSCHYGCVIDGGFADWTPPDFSKFGDPVYYTDSIVNHTRDDSAEDWFQHYMIGTGGLCSVYDPPVGYWCSENPSGGAAFAFRTPTGITPHGGVLAHGPYSNVDDMIINVWRPARWENWMFEVEEYDGKTFKFGQGGNQGARGDNNGGPFFVENVFEELDHPGEFYFDKTTGFLYLYHNSTGAPAEDMDVVVPQERVLVNISGTQWDPVKDLTIDGVTFKSTRYTYMDPHGVPSAGDWAMEREAAVFMQGTESVTLMNSVFERLDGTAVMISGYNRNTTVKDNDFAFIGGSAIVSWGYTNETENSGFPYYTPNTNYPKAGVDGTDGNHPRFNMIVGNTGREIGHYEKQNSFYMQAKTAQSTITGNVFFNGPRAGINYNDGFGGGDELSHNLVFSVCRDSGDHGPFNSWDRQPFLTDVRTGEPSMFMAWREIHHNFFIDNYSPQEGVDNDDGSGYYHTHHNFLVYGGQGQKMDFGGHDNHHYNNIYGYVVQAIVSFDAPAIAGHEDKFFNNRVVMTGHDVGSACSSIEVSDNHYFTPTGEVNECGHGPSGSVTTHPSDDELLGWASELLSITGHFREVTI